jgi:hypothetical protein
LDVVPPTEVSCLDHAHAAAAEAAVIGRAPGQTTGQLQASARRAVLAAGPAAADRHREKAEKEARVEVWSGPSGTAALVGRDIRSADVIAAGKRTDMHALKCADAGITIQGIASSWQKKSLSWLLGLWLLGLWLLGL